jgi:flagellar hook-associated protein 1 FlgK
MSSALMSLGMRAMSASQAALQTTGHNIANANVAGYSRQQVELGTSKGQYTGAGFFGKGVDVQTVTRAHDAFLTREAAVTQSAAAMDAARLSSLTQLEAAFRPGELGIGHAAGQFLNAFVDLASRPADAASRQVVLARAGDVAERFAGASRQLDAVQSGVNEDLAAAVTEVNTLAASIASVNERIAALRGLGQSPNDLLDERERLVQRLSAHVQVSTVGADDGTLSVFVGGGQRLVLGVQPSTLAVVADPGDSSRRAIALSEGGGMRVLDGASFGGGSIAGKLRFQNSDLVAARNALGQMAAALAAAVNEQQALGLDLRNPPGQGEVMFRTGAPQAIANQFNARDSGGNFLGSVSLTLVDATQVPASEYELRADPSGTPGQWRLTRLSDGLARSVASSDTIDGFTVQVSGSPAATDRFLLHPISRAASGMARSLDDPLGIAAASPVVGTSASGNQGTGAVKALSVVSSSLDPNLNASIVFSNDSGAYTWELRDRSSNALVSSGTGSWSLDTPIALNGFELSLSGAPLNGDRFDITRTAYPAASNANALALVSLRDAPLVGRELQGNGTLAGGMNLTDAWAAALGTVGVRVQGARTSAEVSANVSALAQTTLASRVGVNLDEEAARLIQFQQSYQAAARVLMIAQSIFDTLLETAR